jgi:hypothetical protein
MPAGLGVGHLDVGIDQPRIDRQAIRLPDARIGWNGDVGATAGDDAVANHDGAALDGLAGGGDDSSPHNGVDARRRRKGRHGESQTQRQDSAGGSGEEKEVAHR